MTRLEQLKADLLQNFKDFQGIDAEGGSDEANTIVAQGLAESIDRAIEYGLCALEFRGEMTVDAINAETKRAGYVYTVLDSGILAGNPVLNVTPNTVVAWDGTRFKTVLRLFPADSHFTQVVEDFVKNFKVDPFMSTVSTNPVQNRLVTQALNSERSERVAADEALQEQINEVATVYETKADAKAKANAWGVDMRYQATNTLKFFRPNL